MTGGIRRNDGRETWSRLRDWDKGPTSSERLAAALLRNEGFDVEPSHPLGGPDGGRDAILKNSDGGTSVMAVYFPRGQKAFSEIKDKFQADVSASGTAQFDSFVFVTNQEIKLSERKTLRGLCPVDVELCHLETLSSLLDQPKNYGIRLDYLDIEMTTDEVVAFVGARDLEYRRHLAQIDSSIGATLEKVEGYATGGDSYPHISLRRPTLDILGKKLPNELEVHVHVRGEYPLRDMQVEVKCTTTRSKADLTDPFSEEAQKVFREQNKSLRKFPLGTMTPAYCRTIGTIPNPPTFPAHFSITVFTLGGVFYQQILVDESSANDIKVINDRVSRGVASRVPLFTFPPSAVPEDETHSPATTSQDEHQIHPTRTDY